MRPHQDGEQLQILRFPLTLILEFLFSILIAFVHER